MSLCKKTIFRTPGTIQIKKKGTKLSCAKEVSNPKKNRTIQCDQTSSAIAFHLFSKKTPQAPKPFGSAKVHFLLHCWETSPTWSSSCKLRKPPNTNTYVSHSQQWLKMILPYSTPCQDRFFQGESSFPGSTVTTRHYNSPWPGMGWSPSGKQPLTISIKVGLMNQQFAIFCTMLCRN